MSILVTGATGFIGQHIVASLLKRRQEVVVVSRDLEKVTSMHWYNGVKTMTFDIYEDTVPAGIPETVMHLAWAGLPNYKELYHFEKNLFKEYDFIKRLLKKGVKKILVTGTCFEYGLQNGELSEDRETKPVTPYGLAKDVLHKFLLELQKKDLFTLQWVRLFYLFGEGQNPKSLLSQLDRAIDSKEKVFNMSKGEQIRDYMNVKTVAEILIQLIKSNQSFVTNCCSGEPISVRSLVERRIKERDANIKLNLGYYPYTDYEPFAFWGSRKKLDKILEEV